MGKSVPGKGVVSVNTKVPHVLQEFRKAVRRPMRLGQSDQKEQLAETYQKGRKAKRCQEKLSEWEIK